MHEESAVDKVNAFFNDWSFKRKNIEKLLYDS